jgi:GntR family transcriptional regulator
MKLWISKSGKVSIHDQLATQLILGIVSKDLTPGERLQSTTQLARRFHIHPNTVRAVYRDLVNRGWIEWRRGSGFYVRLLLDQDQIEPNLDLDHLIALFFRVARDRGYPLNEIQSRVQRWLSLQSPDHIVVIEPDAELRAILVMEVSNSISMRVIGVSIHECKQSAELAGAFCVALYDSANDVRKALPAEFPCLFLHSRSVSETLSNEGRPPADTLITVVSRWLDFLQWAKTTLVSIGIQEIYLDLRDASKKGWEQGLTKRNFIVTDSVLVTQFPKGTNPRVFQIISDDSLKELRNQAQAECKSNQRV